jgi:putative spermidine/putrescine transport system permease protein
VNIYRPGPAAILIITAVALFLLAPLLAVVPISLTPFKYLSMPEGELSLRHYRALIENPEWRASILLSLRIALVSSVVSTVFAVSFGLGIWYLRPRLVGVLVGFVLLPMVVPPVVSAVILYFLTTWISNVFEPAGYDTWIGVALCHVVMVAPFAVVIVLVALSQLDRRIEMAARGLGASLWQTTFAVILPNIRFGIVSAAFLSFVLSWEEIAVTLFVTSVDAITLPRLVWMGLRDNVDPAIAAISVVLTVITVAVILLRMTLAGRRQAGAKGVTEGTPSEGAPPVGVGMVPAGGRSAGA